MGVCAALGMTPIRTRFDPEVRANCTHAACTPHAARPHPEVIGPNNRAQRIQQSYPSSSGTRPATAEAR